MSRPPILWKPWRLIPLCLRILTSPRTATPSSWLPRLRAIIPPIPQPVTWPVQLLASQAAIKTPSRLLTKPLPLQLMTQLVLQCSAVCLRMVPAAASTSVRVIFSPLRWKSATRPWPSPLRRARTSMSRTRSWTPRKNWLRSSTTKPPLMMTTALSLMRARSNLAICSPLRMLWMPLVRRPVWSWV